LPGAHRHTEYLVRQLTDRLGAAAFEDELRLGGQLSIDQALQLAEEIVTSTATDASR
jgi:hypothetical protein